MRIGFLLVLLAGSVFYSYVAFADLSFMTRTGRLGPGFFPRLVGIGMVFFTIWAIIDARRAGSDAATDQVIPSEDSGWGDVVVLMGLAIVYAVLLRLLGGFPASVIYLGVALFFVNEGKHLQNAILAVVIPSTVYILFDRVLNANMPPALYNLPFS